MRPLALVISFCFVSIGAVQAQSSNVRGRVIERGSDVGINAVSLRLLGTEHHATSDSTGQFRIERVKPGEYTLEVSRLGYAVQTQKVKVPNTAELHLEILLTTAPVDLPSVTVRALSEDERARRAEATSTRVLTFEELREAQAKNRRLEDVIRSAGFGLRVREGNFSVGSESAKMLCIEAPSRGPSSFRGGGRASTLAPPCAMVPVFVDGIKIEQAGTYLLGAPLDNFDRIEWLSMIAAGTRFGVLANNKGALVLYSRTGKR